jgi:hypothetical protein
VDRDKTHIETVIENLSLANFDPEFFDQYEGAFLEMYNQKSGKSLTLKSKRKLSMVDEVFVWVIFLIIIN